MKDRYIYPAIFSYDKKDKAYNVSFPDIEDCFTFGETLEEALDSAKDVLQLCMYDREEEGRDIPKASSINDIKIDKEDIVSLIDVWMIPFRNKMLNQSVKKTLTIPKWLNDIAEKEKVNFSQLLQSALKDNLNIK